MSEEELGSSQKLDQSFDFAIDSTGDIDSTIGLDELEKDLSVQMAFYLSTYLGEPPTNQTKAAVRRTVSNVAIADTRIVDVDQENIVVEWDRGMRELAVEVSVTTITNTEYDLVFNV